MAKRKRKRGKRHTEDRGGSARFWATLVRETVANWAGQLMADGMEQMAGRNAGGKGDGAADHADQRRDLAALVLRVLSESGPKSIADLIAETGAGLTPLLSAVESARQFRLVDVVEEGELVQLTPSGTRTAAVLRREQIERGGRKLLEA